ncbi:response regulator receiver protein [Bosea sp. BIWAKO-01]|nr:response regulator receiver protein [Bosea sp. BIWAKO-01]
MDAVDFIEDAGFRAIEARDADEAMAILNTRNDIAVMFTDIEMPGSMDGINLAHAVREGWPPVTIVVASGRLVPAAEDLPDNTRYLKKPYRPAEVIEAFRHAA